MVALLITIIVVLNCFIGIRRQIQSRQAAAHASAMPSISEKQSAEEERISDEDAEMDDFLEEAMEDDDDSFDTNRDGPTPPKNARRSAVSIRTGCSPTASAASWEFETPNRREQQQQKVLQ